MSYVTIKQQGHRPGREYKMELIAMLFIMLLLAAVAFLSFGLEVAIDIKRNGWRTPTVLIVLGCFVSPTVLIIITILTN